MNVERPAEKRGAMNYLSMVEAAARLGCAVKTVTRAARAAKCGVYTNGGSRLAAISPMDIPRLRPHIHTTSGNPVWIASKKTAARARRKAKPPA